MQNKFITKVVEVNEEPCLVFPKEVVKSLLLKEGDQIVFEIIDKDSFKIYKKD